MTAKQGHEIEAFELGPMENFVYLIHDRATGRAAVVDPAWEPEVVIQRAAQRGVRITDILLTHSHHDHINGIAEVQGAHDAQLHLSKAEARFWGDYPEMPTLHHGGDVISLGETDIEVLLTPGHTPGSVCYRMGDNLITGDTLFVFGCGRCDLRGGDPEQMFDSLRRLRRELPVGTVVHPGHNYSVKPRSSLQEEADGNPFMHFHTRADFVRYRMHYHDRHRHSPYGPVAPGREFARPE